jgi:putative drug exporter of the RND superfamily
MLSRLAVFTVRRPKVILIAVLALLGVSIVFGGTVTQKLGVGGFVDPAAESSQVADYLDQNFLTTPNLVLQVIARDGAVENPAVAAAAGRIRQLVEAEPAAKAVGSFSQESAADLRSRDGRSGLILVHVGGTLDEATKTAIRIIDKLPTDDPAVDVRAGGPPGCVGGDRGPGQSRSRHQREHRAAHLARRARDRLRRPSCRSPSVSHPSSRH